MLPYSNLGPSSSPDRKLAQCPSWPLALSLCSSIRHCLCLILSPPYCTMYTPGQNACRTNMHNEMCVSMPRTTSGLYAPARYSKCGSSFNSTSGIKCTLIRKPNLNRILPHHILCPTYRNMELAFNTA
jgi:hypothetical protein